MQIADCKRSDWFVFKTGGDNKHKCSASIDPLKRLDCGNVDMMEARTLLDLPVEVARRVWYGDRVQGLWKGKSFTWGA